MNSYYKFTRDPYFDKSPDPTTFLQPDHRRQSNSKVFGESKSDQRFNLLQNPQYATLDTQYVSVGKACLPSHPMK
jgi:hypothetical protein